jgi:hypothetical protein
LNKVENLCAFSSEVANKVILVVKQYSLNKNFVSVRFRVALVTLLNKQHLIYVDFGFRCTSLARNDRKISCSYANEDYTVALASCTKLL